MLMMERAMITSMMTTMFFYDSSPAVIEESVHMSPKIVKDTPESGLCKWLWLVMMVMDEESSSLMMVMDDDDNGDGDRPVDILMMTAMRTMFRSPPGLKSQPRTTISRLPPFPLFPAFRPLRRYRRFRASCCRALPPLSWLWQMWILVVDFSSW